ncbi:hypothetical protein DO88_09670 [Pseudoalteromonas sp. S3431]|nr:hypothetical protein DO88_09670 [Pseudoalteromonas sp. S3431]
MFFILVISDMYTIQSYLLSLGITQYQPSIEQIQNIVKLVQHSFKSPNIFTINALDWANNNKRKPFTSAELTLLSGLLVNVGYKLSMYSAKQVVVVHNRQSLLITFGESGFSTKDGSNVVFQ